MDLVLHHMFETLVVNRTLEDIAREQLASHP